MNKFFFEEIKELGEIPTIIDDLEVDEVSKEELLLMVKSIIHHKVLDSLLAKFKDDSPKETFLITISTGGDSNTILSRAEELIPDLRNMVIETVEKEEKELTSKLRLAI